MFRLLKLFFNQVIPNQMNCRFSLIEIQWESHKINQSSKIRSVNSTRKRC